MDEGVDGGGGAVDGEFHDGFAGERGSFGEGEGEAVVAGGEGAVEGVSGLDGVWPGLEDLFGDSPGLGSGQADDRHGGGGAGGDGGDDGVGGGHGSGSDATRRRPEGGKTFGMRRCGAAWLVLVGLMVAGCSGGDRAGEGVPVDTTALAGDVAGKFRLDMSAEEVVEVGGLEKVPVLFLAGDGRWSLTNDGEAVKGTYTYEAGKVSLSEDGAEEATQVFLVQEGGARLTEDGGEGATVWVKVMESEEGAAE